MEPLPRPDVILTHESDLDGFVAGHLFQRLARKLFNDDVRLEAWNTQAWRQRPMKEGCAWVCDFAPDSRIDRPGWLIVDHHALDAPPKQARLIHDAGASASRLVYGLCRDHGLATPGLDRIVELTDVSDLFREEHEEFELAQDYASLLKTYPFWNLSRMLEGDPERLLDHPLLDVVRTRRRVEDPIGLAWSKERIVDVGGGVGCVDIVVGNANRIVHELLCSPECRHPVLATLMRKVSAGVVVSFRSRGGQALEIARRFQGGGHPNAAGATLPRAVQSLPDAIDYLRRILNPQPPAKPPGMASLEDAFAGLKLPA